MKSITLKDIILFGGIIAVILLFLFKGEPQIIQVDKPRIIENRIEGAEKEIHHYTERVGDNQLIISELSDQIDGLRFELEKNRSIRDTFLIVRTQDTLIEKLTEAGNHKDSVITDQFAIIGKQRYIIDAKDTLLAISHQKIKKIKRQRFWSIAGNVVQTAIIILLK